MSTNSKLAQTLKHTLHASGENGGISARLTTELAKGRIIERRNSNRYHGRMTRKAEISRRYIYVIVVDYIVDNRGYMYQVTKYLLRASSNCPELRSSGKGCLIFVND